MHYLVILFFVRSEGSATVGKNIRLTELTWKVPTPPQQSTDTNENHAFNHSSDDSDVEDGQYVTFCTILCWHKHNKKISKFVLM